MICFLRPLGGGRGGPLAYAIIDPQGDTDAYEVRGRGNAPTVPWSDYGQWQPAQQAAQQVPSLPALPPCAHPL